MAADVGRWLKYAQAKLSRAVDAGNEELDELEAEQAAAVADKPWLSADGDAPTLEETKARIEWEAEEQRRRSEAAPAPAPAAPSTGSAPTGSGRTAAGQGSSPTPATAPVAEDPEVAAARIELDRQARESKARLEAIREELGVDPPPKPPSDGA